MVRVRVIQEFGDGYGNGYVLYRKGAVVEIEAHQADQWAGIGRVEPVPDEPVKAPPKASAPPVAAPHVAPAASKAAAPKAEPKKKGLPKK